MAKELNKKALSILPLNRDSSLKALSLLDSAVRLDSNFFAAYWNMFSIKNSLGLYKETIPTLEHLQRIKPTNPDLPMFEGLMLERTGDSLNSKKYFNRSLTLFNAILDTLNQTNKNYNFTKLNQALCLILSGDESSGRQQLKTLAREPFAMEYLNKSRQEIIEWYMTGKE
ncbi:hypothetical protein NF867_05205 [Solitalea sp. MAHUQ-68]|uniref:Tetratricopeptide repeat protein n=1 Tax=Solitalea agri TaxID=2953739 RepID=A0A9X2F047_9SPHI|nr:hypothetical protein [Solitalea agri]MCO4292259.1 hypothetical protein [Solitalea agri]